MQRRRFQGRITTAHGRKGEIMKDDLERKQADAVKKARAKRADLDAMQERFEAIKAVVETVPSGQAMSEEKTVLIFRLADGEDLNVTVRDAGMKALGLSKWPEGEEK